MATATATNLVKPVKVGKPVKGVKPAKVTIVPGYAFYEERIKLYAFTLPTKSIGNDGCIITDEELKEQERIRKAKLTYGRFTRKHRDEHWEPSNMCGSECG
jgi:hypothetical protein